MKEYFKFLKASGKKKFDIINCLDKGDIFSSFPHIWFDEVEISCNWILKIVLHLKNESGDLVMSLTFVQRRLFYKPVVAKEISDKASWSIFSLD
jgi:hypothetical protein